MNRTLKEATVRRCHYDTHQQVGGHLAPSSNAYNFARRLKTLAGLTPSEHICKAWTIEPALQTTQPSHIETKHLACGA
jgi:hypothetical protein